MNRSILSFICASTALISAADVTSYLPENIQDGVILHCFVWPMRDVINELPQIAQAGFKAVQISPMQAPNVQGQPWYYTYGPIDYAFYDSALGTRSDLIELCDKANDYGIKVIMDVCANHMMSDASDKWRAPEQYTVDWWRTDGRAISEQGDVKWDSRWSMTQQNIFGMEVATEREDVQQRMRTYLADLYSMGIRGIRWDSAKHIAVPSEGDNFWPSVLKDCGMWTYAEILGDINYAPELMGEYISQMSVTDITFNGWNNKSWQYNGQMPRTRSVFWSESHDTFSNGQDDSQLISQNDIDRRWALVASRKGATALYFSRPQLLPKDDIKLAVKGSTHFKMPEVSEVNRFHNLMGAEPEEFYASGGVAAVYRRKGVVIVTDKPGPVEIPVKNLLTGLHYKDQVGGAEFILSGDKIVGEVGETRIAVVYDTIGLSEPVADVDIWPQNLSFTTPTASYTLTPTYCTKATVTINGGNPIEITQPTQFTVGEDADYYDEIKIEWEAGDGNSAASGEYIITKVDPRPTYVYLHSDTDWTGLDAYMFIYDNTGMISPWPGKNMTFNPEMIINGKSGWWVCEIPDKYKLSGMAMVSTSDKYRYPADGVPGVPVEGKSIAFEYKSGEWAYSLLTPMDEPDDNDENLVHVYFHHNKPEYDDASFYCFVYGSNGNNAGWPGCVMERDDNLSINGILGGWYVYEVPENLVSDGMAIISNCGGEPRYPANMQPGIPIKGKDLVFTMTDNNWITSDVTEKKNSLFGGGAGTADDPYLISEPNHLIQLASSPHYLCESICYRLESDLSLPEEFNGIGSATYPFCGEFDGNGHCITGLHIKNNNMSHPLGFFNCTRNAKIHDLGIVEADVAGEAMSGALVGRADYSEIARCYSSGRVSVNTLCGGGLIGATFAGQIEDCYSHCDVEGENASAVGGLIGKNLSLVSRCYSAGNVKGYNFIGGLIGHNRGIVERSVAINPHVSAHQLRRHAGVLIGSNKEFGGWDSVYAWCETILDALNPFGFNATGHQNDLFSPTLYSDNKGNLQWDFDNTWIWHKADQQKGIPLLKQVNGQAIPANHPAFYIESGLLEISNSEDIHLTYYQLTSDLKSDAEEGVIKIFSSNGILVKKSTDQHVDCTSLPAGIYIAVNETSKGIVTLKFRK